MEQYLHLPQNFSPSPSEEKSFANDGQPTLKMASAFGSYRQVKNDVNFKAIPIKSIKLPEGNLSLMKLPLNFQIKGEDLRGSFSNCYPKLKANKAMIQRFVEETPSLSQMNSTIRNLQVVGDAQQSSMSSQNRTRPWPQTVMTSNCFEQLQQSNQSTQKTFFLSRAASQSVLDQRSIALEVQRRMIQKKKKLTLMQSQFKDILLKNRKHKAALDAYQESNGSHIYDVRSPDTLPTSKQLRLEEYNDSIHLEPHIAHGKSKSKIFPSTSMSNQNQIIGTQTQSMSTQIELSSSQNMSPLHNKRTSINASELRHGPQTKLTPLGSKPRNRYMELIEKRLQMQVKGRLLLMESNNKSNISAIQGRQINSQIQAKSQLKSKASISQSKSQKNQSVGDHPMDLVFQNLENRIEEILKQRTLKMQTVGRHKKSVSHLPDRLSPLREDQMLGNSFIQIKVGTKKQLPVSQQNYRKRKGNEL